MPRTVAKRTPGSLTRLYPSYSHPCKDFNSFLCRKILHIRYLVAEAVQYFRVTVPALERVYPDLFLLLAVKELCQPFIIHCAVTVRGEHDICLAVLLCLDDLHGCFKWFHEISTAAQPVFSDVDHFAYHVLLVLPVGRLRWCRTGSWGSGLPPCLRLPVRCLTGAGRLRL